MAELEADGIALRDLPDEVLFVQDASRYPGHTTGGVLVVVGPI